MAERAYFRLVFPENLEQEAVDAFVNNLSALPRPYFDFLGLFEDLGYYSRPIIVSELWGDRSGIHHRIALPSDCVDIIDQLRTTAPGLHVDEDDGAPIADFMFANEYGLSSNIMPMSITDPERVASSILTSLQPMGSNDVVAIQWIISPANRHPPRRRNSGVVLHDGLAGEIRVSPRFMRRVLITFSCLR